MDIWSLIEGNRYDYAKLRTDKIDSPIASHRTLLLKLSGGSLNKTAGDGTHYVANLKFVVIGEELL